MIIPGFSSTGSKRPAALFGDFPGPETMVRAEGCRVWDAEGREYVDTTMALGAVALGYAHPAVAAAAERGARGGVVGPLAPVLEGAVAERLAAVIPGTEAVRFFKSGAEAVAAAVRVARIYTARERVITCGYHGWLDWCQDVAGVPAAVVGLRREIPFNDVKALRRAVEQFGPVAALVIEPVIEAAPDPAWLGEVRKVASRTGAVLVFDEIKTAFRIAVGGAAERYGVVPDLAVVAKAFGNGFPIAALLGSADVMDAVTRTWISSTLATEYVSLAVAAAVLDVYERADVIEHLARVGSRLNQGLTMLAANHAALAVRAAGIPQMCYLAFQNDQRSCEMASKAAARGFLFKRNAYNFVSLAHSPEIVDRILEELDAVLTEMERAC